MFEILRFLQSSGIANIFEAVTFYVKARAISDIITASAIPVFILAGFGVLVYAIHKLEAFR